uniref:Uncharacterized protein n=1 Tax=Fusarium oxysporum (strain Fo5176) TaxID=660025 RepID=A0A0D2XHI5_FUSOF
MSEAGLSSSGFTVVAGQLEDSVMAPIFAAGLVRERGV